MEKAKNIEITVTKQDLRDMIDYFMSRTNDLGIHSTGDMVMIAQLQVEFDNFDKE